jgi:hypothetical protein
MPRVEDPPVTAPSDADKPASGPAGAKSDASRPLPAGSGTPGKVPTPGPAPAGTSSPVPKVPETPKPGLGGGTTSDGKPLTTASGATAGPAGSAGKPAPLAATPPAGKVEPAKPGSDKPATATGIGVPPVSPTGVGKPEPLKTESPLAGGKSELGKSELGKPAPGKLEPAKPASPAPGGALKSDAPKTDPLKADAPKSETAKADPAKVDASKPDASKADPVNAAGPSARPGGPAGPVTGAAVTAGPILDLKATRVPDPAAGSKDPTKATAAAGSSGQAKPASAPGKAETPAVGARGPAVTPPSSAASPSTSSGTTVPPTARSGAGFGSIAAAGLLGGVIGAGLLFAVEKAGIGGDAGPVNALDQKLSGQIAALDQRVGTLAPKDALGTLDQRVAAAEASAKQANEKAASAGQNQGAGGAAVPADLASRLDSLDQRVSALQEEPGRDASGNPAMGVAQIESSRQIADLDARLKAVEGAGNAGAGSADTAKALASLKGDVEARTKQNADAVAALGQRLDGLRQSLGDQVKSATESVQAATEASRKAAEASQTQAAESSKAVERRFTEQADRITTLDKGLADRAPASTVQAALRVVVADRIASALASGTPYAEPLATLAKLDPQAQGQAGALKPFADKGAPTVGQLAETFRGIGQSIAQARRAAQTKAAADSGDFRTKLLSMADGLVQVRKVDGNGPAEGPAAAPEEKVQAALDRGDLEGAAAAFEALPAEAKAQAGDFGATLAARAKAAQASRTLTASAFSALPAPNAAPTAAPTAAPAPAK